jgi:serine/threonine-protein kinase
MAPESLASGREFDHRADLFALGIVLHETLTGRSLFRGATDNDTLRRVRTMPIPDVTRMRPDTPPGLAALIARALERDPDRRFQTATDVLHSLEQVAEEAHIHRSVTRLRDEVLDRCGDPPFPALTEEERAMLDEAAPPLPPPAPPLLDIAADDAGITVAEPISPDLNDALAQVLGQAPISAMASAEPDLTLEPASPAAEKNARSSAVPRPVAHRDPQLAYFLRQAALAPRRRREQPADPELADILATLDR